ncbi:MAG: hypothetical protein WC575_01035 [Patescibacteria group bacterium]
MDIKSYCHTGCMGSGKTGELIRACNLHLRAGRNIIVFRPQIDNRLPEGTLKDKNGMEFKGLVLTVKDSQEVLVIALREKLRALGVDEGQFFDPLLAKVLEQLAGEGIICTYAGLDTDYIGRAFPTTKEVLCSPEIKVFRWKAICDSCGSNATRSIKRLNDHRIVTPEMDSELIEIGEGQYNSVCYVCFMEAMKGTLSEEKLIKLINKNN